MSQAMGADQDARDMIRGPHHRIKKTSFSDAQHLFERIKELECLYAIANLVEKPDITFGEMLQGIVSTLPPAFQYPDIASARLSLDFGVWQCGSLHRTRARLTSPVRIKGKERGQLDVFYGQLRPTADEGPFLAEERRLLDAVAERIGRIVERRETEEALAAERRLLNGFMEVVNDEVIIFDSTGRMIKWNRTVRESSGYSDEEIARMSVWDFIHPDSMEKSYAALSEVIEKGTVRFEATVRRKDGTPRNLEFTGAILRNSAGEIVNICAMARDVTDRNLAEEAIRRSEQLFRTFFNSAGDAIFVTTLDGRILDANEIAIERYGYTLEELLSMRRGDLRATDYALPDPDEMQDVVDNWLEPLETVHRRKDGSEFPVERVRSLIDYGGEPAVLAIIRDITERKKTEKALAESREEYRSIANLSGDIIVKTDAEGRITFVNFGAMEFYGKREEELLGQTFRDLRHPDDRDRTEQVIAGFRLDTTRVQGYINRHMSAQGWRTVSWNATPFYGENGEYQGFQATGRDITDQINAEEELRLLNAELEGFAHTVSHDLRGPLAAILLASEAFTDFATSPGEDGAQDQMLKMADVIRRNVDRAKTLIADLITLARADRFNEETELIDIGHVVASVLEERAREVAERGAEVIVEEDLGKLCASSTHMYQLFSNLVGNALKYCCTDTSAPRIEIRHTGQDGAGHHYLVRDNGPGIPEEMLDNAFEPFVKGDAGGTGIGLAIVAKIVAAYGGSISASNEGGAVFRFTLRDAPANL